MIPSSLSFILFLYDLSKTRPLRTQDSIEIRTFETRGVKWAGLGGFGMSIIRLGI